MGAIVKRMRRRRRKRMNEFRRNITFVSKSANDILLKVRKRAVQ